MRPRRSTVVVFVVVAAAWFAVSYGVGATQYAYSVEYEDRWDEASPAVQRMWDAWDYVVWMSVPVVAVYPAAQRAAERLTGIVSPYLVLSLSAVLYAANALLWATLIATTYVFVRHLRERRAAPREA